MKKSFKPKSKNHCMIFYLDEITEEIDFSISEMAKYFDTYVFIHKKLGIDPDRFMSLNPITGYVYGKESEAFGVLEVMKMIDSSGNNYFLYLISDMVSRTYYECLNDALEELISKGLMEKSIFKSVRSDYDMRLSACKKKWYEIFGWKGKYNCHSTRVSDELSLILTRDAFNKVVSIARDNEDYINTFKHRRAWEMIPSMFDEFDIDFMNKKLSEVLGVLTI